MEKKKVILVIRDGWGYRKESTDNAIAQTSTPFTDMVMKDYPNTLINASGEAVGVPSGYQGNSEVGHMTIGSGRIIYQSLVRINQSIKTGEFFELEELKNAVKNAKEHNTTIHLIGLLQDEGVHAHIDHLFALLDLCKKENHKNVKIHLITDGRDAPVTASLKHVTSLNKKLEQIGFGEIVSISGRFFAMDRDNRWDRTEKAYRAIVEAKSETTFEDALEKIKSSHNNNETDEFITPTIKGNYTGFTENDSVIFFNFRTDRPRQFTKAVVEDDFDGFPRKKVRVFYVGMTKFYVTDKIHSAFKDQSFTNLLGQVIAKNNKKQLRISETEKYAHVTFFFNGQIEKPNENEDRILIDSPKVKTYDLQPEMSAPKIANEIVRELDEKDYDLIVTNLVNGDMVGHTGLINPIHEAVKAVDSALEKITTKALEKGYTLLVFADHGNVEDQSPEWRTSHTTNPVPLILISNDKKLKSAKLKENMGLQDIAPTTLKLMGIDIPEEMTGQCIIE